LKAFNYLCLLIVKQVIADDKTYEPTMQLAQDCFKEMGKKTGKK
jgi:hypothetical protein